ncbi:oxidoreductase [Arthrobacter sp. NPDC089319]|uniref:oxidoreductase n=1 Tax=Arthrobacter sp. NPDC089319 TaxID=3155915 RepID=UPI00343206E1
MDKVALVTGASSGIGEHTCRELARRGFTVYAAARRLERMRPLEEHGVRALGMDLTDDESMVGGVERILAEQGRLDVLVNNAGYASYGAVEDVPLADARQQFEVNLFGMGRLIQLAAPAMRAQGGGRIINVSSIGGVFYEPLAGWYHAAKFAVEGLSDSLRVELKPFGIGVVIIQPGPILTEWSAIADSLLQSSEGTAYEQQAESVARTVSAAYAGQTATRPEVVGQRIARVAAARRTRSRYPVGRGARTIMSARRLLPDRVFDAVLARVYQR